MDADSAERLRRVVLRLARYLNADSTAEGLTPTQASVLGVVVGCQPVGVAEIAATEGLNPTMVSRILTKLEDLELITRTTAHQDQRVVTVSASPRGQDLHVRLKRERAEAVAWLVSHLEAPVKRRLEEALPALELLTDAAASARDARHEGSR